MPASRNRGLVLIELLIALVVIGILAGIAIPKFLGAKTRAREAAVIADMQNARRAVQEYESNHMTYPGSMEEAGVQPSDGVEFTSWELSTANGTPYLLLEARHQNSDYIFYTAYPLDAIKKRKVGEEPDFDWLNPSESVAK